MPCCDLLDSTDNCPSVTAWWGIALKTRNIVCVSPLLLFNAQHNRHRGRATVLPMHKTLNVESRRSARIAAAAVAAAAATTTTTARHQAAPWFTVAKSFLCDAPKKLASFFHSFLFIQSVYARLGTWAFSTLTTPVY